MSFLRQLGINLRARRYANFTLGNAMLGNDARRRSLLTLAIETSWSVIHAAWRPLTCAS